MGQRQRLSLHIPGSPLAAVPESTATYTPSSAKSERRRSLMGLPDSLSLNNLSTSIGSNLRPAKAKLQQYWPGARSPTLHGRSSSTTSTTDLSALIMLAGEQMGALADPRRKSSVSSSPSRPVSRRRDDPQLQQDLENSLPKSATGMSRRGSIHRKPLPSGAAAGVPVPKRAPPPPPIPELSAVNFHYGHEDDVLAELAELESPSSPVMAAAPVFPVLRRRAKTPVHRIGQLELAAQKKRDTAPRAGNMDGINRMSSVSTIAREYRDLAVYPDTDVPEVPRIDPSYLVQQGLVDLPAAKEPSATQDVDFLTSTYPGHRHSSSLSDDGTMLDSEPDTSFGSCPSLTHSSSPHPETSDDDEEPPALASLRFQIGLELLTKELSTAFADQSGRRQKDAGSSAGLQIWVMIEAYERLREQLHAKPSEENKPARDAIDSWIRALYTIHGTMASEEAGDESDYENDQ